MSSSAVVPFPAPAARAAPVIVVEADDGTRTLISEVLAGGGLEVLPTSNGIEALAAIRLLDRRPPAAIVVDASLPVMDARAFLRAYRREPGPHAPVVVLADDPAHCLPEPAGDVVVLPKPFDPEELLAVVQRLMKKQPAAGC
jgi:CheY-like chemotaxis protein